MTAFSDLRDELLADLAVLTGVSLSSTWPVTGITPPCAFITPPLAALWVDAGGSNDKGVMFQEAMVNLDLVIAVDNAGGASAALEELEGLVQTALHNTMNWRCNGVESPGPTRIVEGGAEYLASVIHLARPVTM